MIRNVLVMNMNVVCCWCCVFVMLSNIISELLVCGVGCDIMR